MFSSDNHWGYDDRGQQIPLRADPERVWKRRRSFALDRGRGLKKWKHDPRVMFVLALRDLSELELKPNTTREVWFVVAWQVFYSLITGALLYGIALREFFGDWNWLAITLTLLVCVISMQILLLLTWWRSKTSYQQIVCLIRGLSPFCGGCWYPIGEQVDEDGCTVCPECGAAWQLQDFESEASAAS